MSADTTAQASGPELAFWRTLYRYLLSIVASLACGAAWWLLGVRLVHLGWRTTMFTGIVALSLGFLLMGYLWLSLDLSRPAPTDVDEREWSYQLFFLWLGIPAIVIGVIAFFAILALVIGPVVYPNGLR